MTGLAISAQQIEMILRAEIAALLHNIGKLDPNFLASTSSDTSTAVQELQKRNLHRRGYQYERFATPNPSLLHLGRAELENTAGAPITAALQSLLAGRSLPTDRQQAAIQAGRRFNAFRRGSGPLDAQQEATLRSLPDLAIAGENWPLPDLLTLFWDDFFAKPRSNHYIPGDDNDPDYGLGSKECW